MKLTRTALGILGATFIAASFTAACGDSSANNDGGAGSRNGPDSSSGDDDPTPTGPECSEPGGRECLGSASGIVCAEGSTAAVTFTCAQGEVCEDGDCVGQCEGGATECVGDSAMRICAADGREWVNVACADGTTCQDGQCLLPGGLVCTPGEKSCDGASTTVTCKEDGSGYEETECPADTECADGGCRGSVCTIGDTKCDDSASNWIYDWFENNGQMPNLSVVYTCVDGSAWVPSPCPSDSEAQSYCSYTDMNPADVAAIQASTVAWANANWRYEDQYYDWLDDGGSESGYPEPQLPPAPLFEVPDSASAECVEFECGQAEWQYTYLHELVSLAPEERRDCGHPTEEVDPWTQFSSCEGLPPYAPLTIESQECGDEAICETFYSGESYTAACFGLTPDETALEGDCYPGESVCTGDTTYQYCYWDGEGSGSYWSGESSTCPGEVPSACTGSGTFPEREAACGGTPVSELPL